MFVTLYHNVLQEDRDMPAITFHTRRSVEQVKEGFDLAPKFGKDGLVPCVTTDATSHQP
jgi:phosphoribosyl-AMP cyclohydrolase